MWHERTTGQANDTYRYVWYFDVIVPALSHPAISTPHFRLDLPLFSSTITRQTFHTFLPFSVHSLPTFLFSSLKVGLVWCPLTSNSIFKSLIFPSSRQIVEVENEGSILAGYCRGNLINGVPLVIVVTVSLQLAYSSWWCSTTKNSNIHCSLSA